MVRIINKNSWLMTALVFLTPIMLVFFLGSQMAYSQVKGQFAAYQAIPEVIRLSELRTLPAGQLVMLRGRIAAAQPGVLNDSALLIFQERPAPGREVRFQEEFEVVFPAFHLALPGGVVMISPSLIRDQVMQHELHAIPMGEHIHTGFRLDDTVTVQGKWQPATATLSEVTGITGLDKADLMAEWQKAFQQVSWVRNSLGVLTLASIIVLVVHLRQSRDNPLPEEDEACQTPKTTTAPIV